MATSPEDFSFTGWDEMLRYARAIGCRVLQDWHAAQDSAQNSCISAFTCQLSAPLPKPRSYFGSIAYHEAVRMLRKQAARATEPLTADPPAQSPGCEADAASAMIEAILVQLKAKDRDVLQRSILEGKRNQEVAREQGVTESAAAMRTMRALRSARAVGLKLASPGDEP
jgi:RNA polymerase sigma factor (sigma-70 family)